MPVHVGANSLKNPHHIIILQFSEVVKGHANYVCTLFFKGNQLLFLLVQGLQKDSLVQACVGMNLSTFASVTYSTQIYLNFLCRIDNEISPCYMYHIFFSKWMWHPVLRALES